MILYNKRNIHKKYSVSSGSAGNYWAATDTLEEAKKAGAVIAKKEAWRGKWNLLFITISIDKQGAPGSIFYKGTGWNMYVPVRGSGKRADYILAAIRERHGAAPFVWTRR